MTAPRHDDDTPDPRLRAALEHAPDRALRPALELREAVRRQALAAVRTAASRERDRAPAWWRRPWLSGPGLLGMAASLATVGLGLSLAWRLSVEVEPMPAPSAARHADATPALAERKAAPPPASASALAATPAPAATVAPAEVSVAQHPEPERRRAAAPPPAAPPAALPAPVPAPEASPRSTASTVAPAAAAGLAESATGAVAERQPPAAFAPAAPRPAQDAAAPATLAAKALPAPRQEAAGWPAPLARWAQALFDAGSGVDLPAGWQQLQPAHPAGTPARRRDWWLALLSRTAGRWQAEAAMEPPGVRWQWQGPDGQVLALWLDADRVWLQADGGTWRTPRPAGLASMPGE